jgi:hypothetical protein
VFFRLLTRASKSCTVLSGNKEYSGRNTLYWDTVEVKYERESCTTIPCPAFEYFEPGGCSCSLESRSRGCLEPDIQPGFRVDISFDELAEARSARQDTQRPNLAGCEHPDADCFLFCAFRTAGIGHYWLSVDLVFRCSQATGTIYSGEMGKSLSKAKLVVALAHRVWGRSRPFLSCPCFGYGARGSIAGLLAR